MAGSISSGMVPELVSFSEIPSSVVSDVSSAS